MNIFSEADNRDMRFSIDRGTCFVMEGGDLLLHVCNLFHDLLYGVYVGLYKL